MSKFDRVYHIVHNSNNAATVYMEVFPREKIVTASWSVCYKDNFSKKTGRAIAISRPETFTFRIKNTDNLLDRFFKALYYEIGGTDVDLQSLLGNQYWEYDRVKFLRDKLKVLQKIVSGSGVY